MVDIRLYSPYDSFNHMRKSKCINWIKQAHTNIECYYDADCYGARNDGTRKFALLIEPRGVLEDGVYDFVSAHCLLFDYVFTHDEELLKTLPNAKPINFANIWYENPDSPKNKGITMTCSAKHMTDMHIVRQKMMDKLEPFVDCYGSHKLDRYVSYAEMYDGYRFSVVVENYINDYWFTEKICNCFANKIVPIYYGARKIKDYFDEDGIIICNPDNVVDIVKNLDIEKEYEKRNKAIENNYTEVQKYSVFEDWFYLEYKDLLGI